MRIIHSVFVQFKPVVGAGTLVLHLLLSALEPPETGLQAAIQRRLRKAAMFDWRGIEKR